jgi:PIN domain nuclease of toxin-antitoxin system
LGRPIISYLDTQVATWMAEGKLARLSEKALRQMSSSTLLLSPIVILELQYMFEIGRSLRTARDVQQKLEADLGVAVCQIGFPSIIHASLDENWTRDPFDRIIVAHAKANNFSYLISSDEKIRRHYPRAIW